MFRISLCGVIIEIDNRFDFVERLCRDYLHVGIAPVAFRVKASADEIEAYRASVGRPMPPDEAESYLLYRQICGQMPAFGAYLLHASAVMVEEADGTIRGYAFSARRGGGKTTHTSLWQSCFAGNPYPKVTILNGDKPLVKKDNHGRLTLWGTPWCGKEGKQTNVHVPLNAICFLEKAPENHIAPCDTADTAARMLEATLLPPTPALQDAMAALVGATVRDVPAYVLACRPDAWAVQMAYATLSKAQK